MRRSAILFLAGMILADLSPLCGWAQESRPQAVAAAVPSADGKQPRKIQVQFLISDEHEGRREVVSRPIVRTVSGQPAAIEINRADGRNLRISLLATTDVESFTSLVESQAGGDRASDESAPSAPGSPIHLALTLSEKRDGAERVRCRSQLTGHSGEPALIKVGGLEVHLTPVVLAEDPGKKADVPNDRDALRLLQALQKRISVEFVETPLGEACKEIAKRAGVNIFIDRHAIEDVGLTVHLKINAKAHGIRLSTLLDQMLAPLSLDYVVTSEVIKITSRTQARGEPVTVTYPVADLIVLRDDGQPIVDAEAERDLVEQIAESIAPETWDRQGGRGSIRVFQPTHSLVIRQFADVHAEIAEHLARLRSDRKRPAGAAATDEKPAAVNKGPSETLPATNSDLPD